MVTLLDEDLKIRDGAEHDFYAAFNSIAHIGHAIVCYNNNKPVACGAFKKMDEQTVEIKRMYVIPDCRGLGIGHKLLTELEIWAASLDFRKCVLETGKKQPEAIRLYQKAGYHIIPNYGQYEHIENSVCMEKDIT
ncbi:MAG: GNAT family N-acetyltransferase [Chitinophagaceae bacterium]|nr:GNAT family N-acetyltransferase [Chitinophagaceae bacterium]